MEPDVHRRIGLLDLHAGTPSANSLRLFHLDDERRKEDWKPRGLFGRPGDFLEKLNCDSHLVCAWVLDLEKSRWGWKKRSPGTQRILMRIDSGRCKNLDVIRVGVRRRRIHVHSGSPTLALSCLR